MIRRTSNHDFSPVENSDKKEHYKCSKCPCEKYQHPHNPIKTLYIDSLGNIYRRSVRCIDLNVKLDLKKYIK